MKITLSMSKHSHFKIPPPPKQHIEEYRYVFCFLLKDKITGSLCSQQRGPACGRNLGNLKIFKSLLDLDKNSIMCVYRHGSHALLLSLPQGSSAEQHLSFVRLNSAQFSLN